jgi:hypothetical protein
VNRLCGFESPIAVERAILAAPKDAGEYIAALPATISGSLRLESPGIVRGVYLLGVRVATDAKASGSYLFRAPRD